MPQARKKKPVPKKVDQSAVDINPEIRKPSDNARGDGGMNESFIAAFSRSKLSANPLRESLQRAIVVLSRDPDRLKSAS